MTFEIFITLLQIIIATWFVFRFAHHYHSIRMKHPIFAFIFDIILFIIFLFAMKSIIDRTKNDKH